MKSQLQVLVEMSIFPGKEAAFKEQMRLFIELVKNNEPGTLKYEWFFSADGDRCYVLETFSDGDALLAHIANVGPAFPALLETAAFTIWKIMGNVSSSVAEAVANIAASSNLPTDINSYMAGFRREAEVLA